MPDFIHGLDLSASFFHEIAKPILAGQFPTLRYSAGLIGYGSDVIGFDDPISSDHMWGPRFHIFLPEADFASNQARIAAAFASSFPYQYRGYSTHFSTPDPNDGGVRHALLIDQGEVNPLIEYYTLPAFFEYYLGYTPGEPITLAQWLTFPEHRLLGSTAGRVFHDDLGLAEVRQALAYFPHTIWLWMMASQWAMIAEEEAFVGRCGYVGDELGSALVAARQVQRLMRLCFLQAKQYAPYSKWYGTAFKRLAAARDLLPILTGVRQANDWHERERYLTRAYTFVAEQHNALGITPPVDPSTRDYFGRPFEVLFSGRLVEALLETIPDDHLKQLKTIGSVSQFSDSTAVYDDVGLAGKLQALYR